MAPAPLHFVDRRSGALVEERIFGAVALSRIYGKGPLAALLRRLMPHPLVSAVYGWLQRSPRSRRKVARFVEELGIDASEASQPLAAYPSLDAFFTRKLRDGARPVDASAGTLSCPADGRALAFADVEGLLPIKGARVSLPDLLGGPAPFARAAVLIVRLAPADYHRFHAPAAGLLSAARVLGGPLHSVHPLALAAGAPSFGNRRHVSRLQTDAFGDLVLVEVGAMLVGKIERTREPGLVHKGLELGLFHFGGSTVVVVADAARVTIDADLVANTVRGLETRVRMGERIAASLGAHVEAPSGVVAR